jgi:hypothetical protein
MSQPDASAGLQACRSGVQGDPWFGRCGSSARSGSAAPEEEERNEQSSSVCSTRGSGPIVQRALAAEPRGAREAVAGTGCHAVPEAQEVLLLLIQ